jgi:hypothetical protein
VAKKIKNKRRKKDTPKVQAQSRHWPHLLGCIRSVVIAGVIVGGLTLSTGAPSKNLIERNPKIDPRYPSMMRQAQPKVVLLGNSMLGEGVDERLFMQQTDRRTIKLWGGGWSSAVWYLAMKNVIIPAKPQPDTVVIFFRDHFLTHPSNRVTGNYQRGIDQLAGPNEPLLERLAYLNAMSPLTYQLNQNWSLYQKKDGLKQTFESHITSVVSWLYGQNNTDGLNQNIEHIFGIKNLMPDQLGKAQAKSEAVSKKELYDFEKMLPKSFLPAMLEVARDNGVQLVLVRVKKRRETEGLPIPAGLGDYINDLKQWCHAEQVPLIDFSDEPQLKIEHYADGDHLNRQNGRTLFSRLLAERLKPYLNPAARPSE